MTPEKPVSDNAHSLRQTLSGGSQMNINSHTQFQAEGEAERVVQPIKSLLQKRDGPYMTLLSYQSTLHNGFSPVDLLMGRKIRTTLLR